MTGIVDAAKRFPRWLRDREDDLDEMNLPTIAALPPISHGGHAPPHEVTILATEDGGRVIDPKDVIVQAAAIYDEIRKREQALNIQLTETALELGAERRKTKLQEQDLADKYLIIVEQQNVIASLQNELLGKNTVLGLVRQVLDKLDIKSPPPEERKPRAKRAKKEVAPDVPTAES